MTKRGIMIALALCCAGRTFGWTEAETNAVVRELVKVAAQQRACDESIGGDCLAEPPSPEVTTYESLFASERQASAPDCWSLWTPQERRNAFEDFVRAVSSGNYLRYGASASDPCGFATTRVRHSPCSHPVEYCKTLHFRLRAAWLQPACLQVFRRLLRSETLLPSMS